MKDLAERLTESQRGALLVLLERDVSGKLTYTSNRNGPSFVASGSASRLVDLELAEWRRTGIEIVVGDVVRRIYDAPASYPSGTLRITDKGRAIARAIRREETSS